MGQRSQWGIRDRQTISQLFKHSAVWVERRFLLRKRPQTRHWVDWVIPLAFLEVTFSVRDEWPLGPSDQRFGHKLGRDFRCWQDIGAVCVFRWRELWLLFCGSGRRLWGLRGICSNNASGSCGKNLYVVLDLFPQTPQKSWENGSRILFS